MKQPIPATKPRFAAIFEDAGLDYATIAKTIAELAEIHLSVLDDMMEHIPVMQFEARKVLTILSQHTGLTYNLETLDIPLIPFDLAPHLTIPVEGSAPHA